MASPDFCGVKAAFFQDKMSDLLKYNNLECVKNRDLKLPEPMKNKN
jgi:hypothetical protein